MKSASRLCTLVLSALLPVSSPALAASASKCQLGVVAKLPVTMEGSRASLRVSINGKPSNIWLDSGAFFNFMPKAKAVELGLSTEPLPFGFSVSGIGGSFTPELTKVRDFGIGTATLQNMEFIVGGSDAGNGFIGANLLGLMTTEFDLAKGAVTLFQEKDCSKTNLAYWGAGMVVGNARVLAGEHENDRHIFVEVFINGRSLRAALDTGAPTSLVNRAAAERVGIDLGDPKVVSSQAMAGVGSHRRKSWIARAQVISIGGEDIKNSPIRVVDDESGGKSWDMLLGVDFLMAHHVLVSRPQRTMYLTYNGGPIFSASTDDEIGRMVTREENMGPRERAADPTTADAFAGRASARLHNRDVAGAIADYSSALKLTPGRADLLAARAKAHLRAGQPALAADDIDAAVAIAPGEHQYRLARARIRLVRGDKAGALAEVIVAEAATPKGSLDMVGVADLYERLGAADRGIPLMEAVLQLHRNDSVYPALLNERSWFRALAGVELGAALQDVNAAMKKSGQLPSLLDTRALVQLRMRNFTAAIADETAALDKNPDLSPALFVRGLARAANGDLAGGNEDIARARKIRPGIDRNYATYGLNAPGPAPADAPDPTIDEADDKLASS